MPKSARQGRKRVGSPSRELNGSRPPRHPDDGLSLGKAGDQAVVDRYDKYAREEVPGGNTATDTGKPEAFAKARVVARSNYWLKRFIPLKISVLNYGLSLSPGQLPGKQKTSASSGSDLDTLNEWLDSPMPLPDIQVDPNDTAVGIPSGAEITVRERVMKFIADSWWEFMVCECVIAFWFDSQKSAVAIQPERVRYRDVMGVETLFYTHGLSAQDIKLLPKDQQERFKKAEIAVDVKEGEFFKVLKLERTGFGLPWPALQSIFRTLGTMESLELGESSYAFCGRIHWRDHKMGHAIAQGQHAGKNTHFWKKRVGDAFKALIENKAGFGGDITHNFDNTTEYPHEDVKYFDPAKWESPEHRLQEWGGPLALMLAAKEQTPFLTQLLKAEAWDLREAMRAFLESVIKQAFVPPVPVRVRWSNRIFADSRIAAESLNIGLSSGALSQQTWREEAGFDDAVESARKEAEAAEVEKTPQKFKPAFDSAHGDPAAPKGGAPAGTPNKDSNAAP